jgi:hypothetical protein
MLDKGIYYHQGGLCGGFCTTFQAQHSAAHMGLGTSICNGSGGLHTTGMG